MTDDDRGTLVRNTLLWILAVLWLFGLWAWQDPPRDSGGAVARSIFTWALVVLVPLVSAVLVRAWLIALRQPKH